MMSSLYQCGRKRAFTALGAVQTLLESMEQIRFVRNQTPAWEKRRLSAEDA